MIQLLKDIKIKLDKEFNPKKLILVDNSYLHTKHKSFDPKKIHLKIIIESDELKKIEKLEAHKAIFNILRQEMKDKIHALEIEIK
jgi:BolA protein